ncbi:hypothetical protein ACRVCX_18870, partial [Acinetobacter baumannii]
EWVHVQLHQQKGMISLSPPTICNSARNISEEILNKVTKLLLPLYCKQDIFIFYIQWLIFLLIGNTMKNTMLRKGLTIF